jgi:tetratricopeptide (TPR) repeat protein
VSASGETVQGLYESGRYREVVTAVEAGTTDAEALWFAAQSNLRLDRPEQARRQFALLPSAGGGPQWQAVSDLALALIDGSPGAIDRAREAAGAFPADPFVQFELGVAQARQNDFAAAALAFDRCAEVDPRFAYAYYNAALAYDRLGRSDLMAIRLETFLRLAPNAPERPEVEAILRTIRGQ